MLVLTRSSLVTRAICAELAQSTDSVNGTLDMIERGHPNVVPDGPQPPVVRDLVIATTSRPALPPTVPAGDTAAA